MATLTWKDVDARIAAPDLTESASLITEGLRTLGDSVRALGTAPDERRRMAAAQELQRAQMEAGMSKELYREADNFFKDQAIRTEKRDMKEFSKNQSFLEAGARKAALSKMSLEDYLANDKVYQSMSEGARAYGASHLSDAYLRGDETRITMEERAKDDAYRAQQDAIRNRQWAMGHALQVETTRLAREERKAAREAAEALKPKVWKTGNDKTDKAMTMMGNQTGMRYNEASGAKYEGQTIGNIGKNYENLGAVSEIFRSINEKRFKNRQELLPDTVLMKILDTNIGNNTFFDGTNDVDDSAITDLINSAGRQYDSALAGRRYYEYLSAKVARGLRPNQQDIDKGWLVLDPPKSEQMPKPKKKRADLPMSPTMMRAGRE